MNYIFCEKQQLLYHQSLKAVQKQEGKKLDLQATWI